MAVLGLWLLAVGLSDVLFGALGNRNPVVRTCSGCLSAGLVGFGGAVLTGLESADALVIGAWSMTTVLSWQLLRGTDTGRPPWRSVAALATLAVAAGASMVAISWRSGSAGGVLAVALSRSPIPSLARLSPDRALLVLGIAAALIETANAVVRLTLDATGVKLPRNRMRGGRIIGPIERLMVFGFALAGELTGAALIVSAKTLLRFPEVSSSNERRDDAAARDGNQREQPSLAEITEYFLIGSLTSWFLALIAGGLARA